MPRFCAVRCRMESSNASIPSKLARCRGVVSIVTFADMGNVKPIPMRLAPRDDLIRALQKPLASDRVRYVGEPLAVVIAESRYQAEDALELIEVEIEELEAVVDARRAVEQGRAYSASRGSRQYRWPFCREDRRRGAGARRRRYRP